MKWLVLAYSTIVTISMSDSDKFTGETPNCQALTRGTDWGKLVPSSHERDDLDTLSTDSSEEEIRDSGSSFYSLIVGAVIYIFHILENKDHCRGGGGGGGGINLY